MLTGRKSQAIQTDFDPEFSSQTLQPLVIGKQRVLSATKVIEVITEYYKTAESEIPAILKQMLMYYKYQEDFDAFAPRVIRNLRLLPYYSSALNLLSHPAFPKEQQPTEANEIRKGLVGIKNKMKRLEIICDDEKLTGTASDIFYNIFIQLSKEKFFDNLSINPAEYFDYVSHLNLHVLESKNSELVLIAKGLLILKESLPKLNNQFKKVKKECGPINVVNIGKSMLDLKNDNLNENAAISKLTTDQNILEVQLELQPPDTENERVRNFIDPARHLRSSFLAEIFREWKP